MNVSSNTHWSALPKYHGRQSIAWALLNADCLPAVSVHWMEQTFDTGAAGPESVR